QGDRSMMRRLAMFSIGMSLLAQWPNHSTPGLRRDAAGKPDLSAPAPRAADGHPDLSGVWRFKKGYLSYVTADLKPDEIQSWAAALCNQRRENFRNDTDGIHCPPPGPKADLSGLAFPLKIVQTPGLTMVLYEYQTIFRQIFTDGRSLPED